MQITTAQRDSLPPCLSPFAHQQDCGATRPIASRPTGGGSGVLAFSATSTPSRPSASPWGPPLPTTLLPIILSSWLVWLSWLGVVLCTEGLLVQFSIRAHAWVAGWLTPVGHVQEAANLMFCSPMNVLLSLSLHLSLKINKYI